MFGARETFALNHMCIQATLLCHFNSRDVRLVGNHDGDFRIRNFAGCYVISNSNEIGATAGKKDAEFVHVS